MERDVHLLTVLFPALCLTLGALTLEESMIASKPTIATQNTGHQLQAVSVPTGATHCIPIEPAEIHSD